MYSPRPYWLPSCPLRLLLAPCPCLLSHVGLEQPKGSLTPTQQLSDSDCGCSTNQLVLSQLYAIAASSTSGACASDPRAADAEDRGGSKESDDEDEGAAPEDPPTSLTFSLLAADPLGLELPLAELLPLEDEEEVRDPPPSTDDRCVRCSRSMALLISGLIRPILLSSELAAAPGT